MTNGSGRDRGKEYEDRLKVWLASGQPLPKGRDGTLNVTALADAVEIPKQSIYKNPQIRTLLNEAKLSRGLSSWSERRQEAPANAVEGVDENGAKAEPPSVQERAGASLKTLQMAQRRITSLEQHNASLIAENFEQRRQLKELRLQLERLDLTIDSGGRIAAPPKRQ